MKYFVFVFCVLRVLIFNTKVSINLYCFTQSVMEINSVEKLK